MEYSPGNCKSRLNPNKTTANFTIHPGRTLKQPESPLIESLKQSLGTKPGIGSFDEIPLNFNHKININRNTRMTGFTSGQASIEFSEDGNKPDYLVKLQNQRVQGDSKTMENMILKDIHESTKNKYLSPQK